MAGAKHGMALNTTELKVVEHLIGALRSAGVTEPQVLSLGYPDLLATADTLADVEARVDTASVATRENSAQLWRNHALQRDTGMLETHSLFAAMGASLTVSDVYRAPEHDLVINLNQPVDDDLLGRFDLVIDPGTVEHCFNIAQAVASVALLLKPGGYAYHQAAVSFINHGFYSLSPTFFADFYEANGFELSRPYHHDAGVGDSGLVTSLEPLSFFDVMFDVGTFTNVTGMFIARKVHTTPTVWPIQRIYAAPGTKDIHTFDAPRAALSDRFIKPHASARPA